MTDQETERLVVGNPTQPYACVEVSCEAGGAYRVELSVSAGHLPAAVRAELVDTLLALPALQPGRRVRITLPAGEAEILHRLRQWCGELTVAQVGASCLLDAVVGARPGPQDGAGDPRTVMSVDPVRPKEART